MTDTPDPLTFAPDGEGSRPIYPVRKERRDVFKTALAPEARAWVEAAGFDAAAGKTLLIPGADGTIAAAAVGLGSEETSARRRFAFAAARAALPEGTWRIEAGLPEGALEEAALGWLLAGYRFGAYKDATPPKARLVAPEGIDAARLEAIAAGEALTRDLINTPANDMGPAEIEAAVRDLGARFGAEVSAIVGEDLLAENFPLIHAVGRAATEDRAPRLIELTWGDRGPALTLVGKGVAFDTGGLNLKPGASMGTMKKDMGGAAAVLGLGQMIMGLGVPVRLRILIPAVENAVSGPSFRPGDILTSRKGLTVEINNTDAEGRLVLADALALAAEEAVDLTVSMATLTGAARVAVGPDIAPFFTDDDGVAAALTTAAGRVADPVWRLPLHAPYEEMIEPGIADLDNSPKGGMAGAITAALFLRRFAGEGPYAHFDIFGWQQSAAPGRTKGGTGQGTRAILDALPAILGI